MITAVITNEDADAETLAVLRAKGVEVMTA
jgi:hypothetical protein